MQILRSRDPDFAERWRRLCGRGSDEDEPEVRQAAARIVADVRARGDAALLEHTRRLDGWEPGSAAALAAGPREFAAAWRALPAAGRRALRTAAGRIEDFHRRETDAVVPFHRDALGARLGQVSRPLARVGLYVPGGTARYPSSVLMAAIPARVAGVREVTVVSPADRATGEVDAWTLAACHASGVSRLFRVGGAQAVAALAYGTETVPAVDKICGPGNAYVAAAKRIVFGQVDIDMIAGPSEILVLADATADAAHVAADLLSQAEHDELATCVLVTDSANADTLAVRYSDFKGTGSGTGIDVQQCTNNKIALDAAGNVFTGFSQAVRSYCFGYVSALNNTFEANGTGLAFLLPGGSGHVVRNNIFTNHTASAASCAFTTFAARDYHVLFGNASNGCLGGDPNTLASDPQYVFAASRDYRLRLGSPAVDTALDLGLYLLPAFPAAPGPRFLGAGPDRGGRESF